MRVLIHACCAPCAVMPVESLRDEGFEVTAYWFNPNIHPYGEWKLRKEALEQLSEQVNLPVIYDGDYDLISSLQKLLSNPIFGERCLICYEDRLRAVAKTSVEKGFDAFTTTLLYSKYQLHEEIREIASRIAEETGAEFLYRDFREFWGRGITASKKMGLYRQRYCGCILSELEAEKQRENTRNPS